MPIGMPIPSVENIGGKALPSSLAAKYASASVRNKELVDRLLWQKDPIQFVLL